MKKCSQQNYFKVIKVINDIKESVPLRNGWLELRD